MYLGCCNLVSCQIACSISNHNVSEECSFASLFLVFTFISIKVVMVVNSSYTAILTQIVALTLWLFGC